MEDRHDLFWGYASLERPFDMATGAGRIHGGDGGIERDAAQLDESRREIAMSLSLPWAAIRALLKVPRSM